MNAFVHTPCAPKVSEAPHSNHQRFTGLSDTSWIHPSKESRKVIDESLRVTRFTDEDQAKLHFEIATKQTLFSTSVALTAAELRDLAQRLLDAAHDIDVNPAPRDKGNSEGETA
jgi:hypothetical protein